MINMSKAKRHFSGDGKVPVEKSSFAKTCNRLSLFLKERGNLSDLKINPNFDVIEKPKRASAATTTATVDLLSKMEIPIKKSTKTEESMSQLPQYICLDSFLKPDDCTIKTFSSTPVEETGSRTEQMTIFYRGHVLVFDDVSADKARDLMLAASDASSNDQIQNCVQLASNSNFSCEAFGSQQQILPGLLENGSDLPIARRVSLHKFLEKRKDRATIRAPYQLHNPSSNHKIDLNL